MKRKFFWSILWNELFKRTDSLTMRALWTLPHLLNIKYVKSTQLKHLNIHYSLLKSNQASLKTFKSVECRLKYSQNKLWILKKYISKVGQIKYKKRNVQNVSTFTNIQKQYYSIRMTLQYNDNWVFSQLCTIDQASFPYTMQWHRLHNKPLFMTISLKNLERTYILPKPYHLG